VENGGRADAWIGQQATDELRHVAAEFSEPQGYIVALDAFGEGCQAW